MISGWLENKLMDGRVGEEKEGWVGGWIEGLMDGWVREEGIDG